MTSDDPAPLLRIATSRASRATRLRVTVTDGRGRRKPAPGLPAWLAGLAPRAAVGEVVVALNRNEAEEAVDLIWTGPPRRRFEWCAR